MSEVKGVSERFSDDVERYLMDKLGDRVSPSEAQEIGAFIGCKTAIYINDILNNIHKEDIKIFRKSIHKRNGTFTKDEQNE